VISGRWSVVRGPWSRSPQYGGSQLGGEEAIEGFLRAPHCHH
jgi:hypothetical protein